MRKRTRTLLAIVVVLAVLLLALLVALGRLATDSLVGLLGVLTGALISEFSHHRSAREERRHQLRLAALDRRLQAHQEAFSLWRKIMADMGNPAKIGETVARCQEWWDNNCLYLTPQARQAFGQAYLTAHTLQGTMASRDIKLIQLEFETIRRAGDLIVEGVELPTIAEGEETPIPHQPSSDA